MVLRLVKLPDVFSAFENAASEEWLVRHADCSAGDFLMLYINQPCVVLGKNQSVFQEVNLEWLLKNPGSIVRRVSGGGTVYHDEGNLNFAIISKFDERKVNNYALFNEPVRKLLTHLGVPATFNERNDMVAEGKKISGNAQFTNRKNIISHGTILVKANLDQLRVALSPNPFKTSSKAVRSVPSSVSNITSFVPQIESTEWLQKHIGESLCNEVFYLNETDVHQIKQLSATKYQTFEWRIARSPKTTLFNSDLSIVVEDGVVVEEIHKNKKASQKLEGLKFLTEEEISANGKAMLEALIHRN